MEPRKQMASSAGRMGNSLRLHPRSDGRRAVAARNGRVECQRFDMYLGCVRLQRAGRITVSIQQMQMQMQGREAVGIVGYASRDRHQVMHQVTIQTEFLDPTPNALENISIDTMNHRDLAGSLVDINQPTPGSSRRAVPHQPSNAILAFPAILISRRESGLVHVTGSPPICGCFGLVSSRLVMPS